MFKKLKNLFKPLRTDLKKPLEHIYTDKFGNRYYQLKEISQISYRRSIAAEVATRQAEFCLTKEQFLKLLDKMREYANEGNIVDLFSVLSEMEQRVQFAGEEETLLQLATVYFFSEDEDIDEYLLTEQQKKLDAWKSDDRARAFFLDSAFLRTKAYTDISEIDIHRFLKVIEPQQSLLNSILATRSSVISTS